MADGWLVRVVKVLVLCVVAMAAASVLAFAVAALFTSAASAFTVSRYFSIASLPEKPLVLKALTVKTPGFFSAKLT